MEKRKTQTIITWGIRMLKEASGCLKDVSGCYEEASGCVHLPDPETSKNRDTAENNLINLHYTILKKLWKIKSQLDKNQYTD